MTPEQRANRLVNILSFNGVNWTMQTLSAQIKIEIEDGEVRGWNEAIEAAATEIEFRRSSLPYDKLKMCILSLKKAEGLQTEKK